MRSITALTVAAALLLSLAGCATSAPSGDCTPTKTSGDASSIVTAKGTFGKAPDAQFPTPLISKGIQVSTVTKGDGDTIYPGQYAVFQATAYDAKTGDLIIAAAYDATKPLTVRAGESASSMSRIFECAAVGSRLAATMNASDLYGFGGVTQETAGLSEPKADIVLVVDVQGSILGKAYGVPQAPAQGMPSVVLTPDGVPGVTIVGDAPTDLKIAVLQQGDGKKVSEGDTIYVHYLRVDWDNPDSFKSTWENFGAPPPVLLQGIDAETGGLNPGMLKAIVGQKVGTQVLAVVPPEYGFPEGTAPDDVTPGATLVYVIDILGFVSK